MFPDSASGYNPPLPQQVPRLTHLLLATAAPGVFLVALGIAVVGPLPPAPVPADSDPTGFSAERAFAHVEVVAAHRRPIGSPGNAAARDYLVERIRGLGLEPTLQSITVPDYYSGRGDVPVVNVIARIAGTDPTGAIVLMAHYDTVPETTGANDNASAVAAVLETGRAIRDPPRGACGVSGRRPRDRSNPSCPLLRYAG